MPLDSKLALLPLLLLVPACGSAGAGPGSGDDRGGPDSLAGFTWSAEPVTINGIEFAFSLRFDDSTVTASNTCDGALTATATAPLRYLYTATIPVGDSVEESEGGATCFASVDAGSFDFGIVSGKLEMSYEGEVITFEPDGPVAGLYGTWRAEAEGVGTLTWSMGDGAIEVQVDCDNGLSANVEVDADFENRVQFTDAAESVVTDDFGAECSVSIASATSEYYFDGDILVMLFDGQEMRLDAR